MLSSTSCCLGCIHMLQQATEYHGRQGTDFPDEHKQMILKYAVDIANDIVSNVSALGIQNTYFSLGYAIGDAALIHCEIANTWDKVPDEVLDAIRVEHLALQSMASRFKMIANRYSIVIQQLSSTIAQCCAREPPPSMTSIM